jgi:queuine tRNA-ribosyltransferase
MNWEHSVLTDSGGFQIFSLENSRTMTEDGASFRSYIDGTKIFLSPEVSINTQRAIGSDIMMVLDQCIPSTADHSAAAAAMHLTHRWAIRSLAARGESPQALFGIVQGACFPDLRRESADFLTNLPFDGFAIGGLAVGETKAMREDFTELTSELLPEFLPRYLMGVGTPIDLLEAVHRGVDMFDCIMPTALAQQGVAFTRRGRFRLARGVYKFADEALDGDCKCSTCANYSRAYLHHLIKASESLGWQLIGFHNLWFYHELMATMRSHILADTFARFYRDMREPLALSDGGELDYAGSSVTSPSLPTYNPDLQR